MMMWIKINIVLVLWTSCYTSVSAQHVIYIPPQGVVRLLPDPSSVPKLITSILWKHGSNKAAEWDTVLGPVVDYYGTFKKRTELDKETGQLVINNMTKADGGNYSVEINGQPLSKSFIVKLMKKVPKPVATKAPCDSNSTSCEVHCIFLEDDTVVTESGTITYRWKKDEGEWMESDSGPNSNRLIVTKDKDGKVKTLTCEVKNEFSMEWSDPEPNPLYPEEPPPEPTSMGAIVGYVTLGIIVTLIGTVLWKCRDRIRKMIPCFPQPDPRHNGEGPSKLEEHGDDEETKPETNEMKKNQNNAAHSELELLNSNMIPAVTVGQPDPKQAKVISPGESGDSTAAAGLCAVSSGTDDEKEEGAASGITPDDQLGERENEDKSEREDEGGGEEDRTAATVTDPLVKPPDEKPVPPAQEEA